MFVLTPDLNDPWMTGKDLEDLRAQLVDELKIADGWEDQVEAVYPADESELDEGEVSPTPRPLTPKLVEELACHVWDKHTVWLVEEEDLNMDDLVHLVEGTFNLPFLNASLAVITHLQTLESNVYTCPINRRYIPDDAKNSVLKAVKDSLAKLAEEEE